MEKESLILKEAICTRYNSNNIFDMFDLRLILHLLK